MYFSLGNALHWIYGRLIHSVAGSLSFAENTNFAGLPFPWFNTGVLATLHFIHFYTWTRPYGFNTRTVHLLVLFSTFFFTFCFTFLLNKTRHLRQKELNNSKILANSINEKFQIPAILLICEQIPWGRILHQNARSFSWGRRTVVYVAILQVLVLL